MNEIQQPGQAIRKIARTCLLGSAALLAGVTPAWAAVSLGAASQFSVLGSTDLTCTGGSVVTGDMGVYPGGFTNTGCTMAGASPPTTNAAAAQAEIDLVGAYNSLQAKTCTQTIAVAAFTGNVPALGPGYRPSQCYKDFLIHYRSQEQPHGIQLTEMAYSYILYEMDE
jgi:hypothetical protein